MVLRRSRLGCASRGLPADRMPVRRSGFRVVDGRRSSDMNDGGDGWLDEGAGVDEDTQIDEYDLTSSPNDFNISTIYNFIDSGAVKGSPLGDFAVCGASYAAG